MGVIFIDEFVYRSKARVRYISHSYRSKCMCKLDQSEEHFIVLILCLVPIPDVLRLPEYGTCCKGNAQTSMLNQKPALPSNNQ
jgi:hypothetical protein